MELTRKNLLSHFHERSTHICSSQATHTIIRYGLVVRIPGSHPGGPGSIPGNGNPFWKLLYSHRPICQRVEQVWICSFCISVKRLIKMSTRMGFEPTRAEHIGLAVQRLNHSATSSSWRRLSAQCQSTTFLHQHRHQQNVPTPGVEPGPSG